MSSFKNLALNNNVSCITKMIGKMQLSPNVFKSNTSLFASLLPGCFPNAIMIDSLKCINFPFLWVFVSL